MARFFDRDSISGTGSIAKECKIIQSDVKHNHASNYLGETKLNCQLNGFSAEECVEARSIGNTCCTLYIVF